MSTIAVTEYNLPAHWANTLVNGDTSGIDKADLLALDEWLASAKPGYCVSCSDESYFSWHNDATHLGGDVLTYTFHTNETT